MKWGVRRYQNPDGSLTDAGKKRYSKKQNARIEKTVNAYKDYANWNGGSQKELQKSVSKYESAANNLRNAFPELKQKLKKANQLMYELEDIEDNKKRDKIRKQVLNIGNDYSSSINKIFQPYKEIVPNYDSLINSLSEDFYDNLYGYAF